MDRKYTWPQDEGFLYTISSIQMIELSIYQIIIYGFNFKAEKINETKERNKQKYSLWTDRCIEDYSSFKVSFYKSVRFIEKKGNFCIYIQGKTFVFYVKYTLFSSLSTIFADFNLRHQFVFDILSLTFI